MWHKWTGNADCHRDLVSYGDLYTGDVYILAMLEGDVGLLVLQFGPDWNINN